MRSVKKVVVILLLSLSYQIIAQVEGSNMEQLLESQIIGKELKEATLVIEQNFGKGKIDTNRYDYGITQNIYHIANYSIEQLYCLSLFMNNDRRVIAGSMYKQHIEDVDIIKPQFGKVFIDSMSINSIVDSLGFLSIDDFIFDSTIFSYRGKNMFGVFGGRESGNLFFKSFVNSFVQNDTAVFVKGYKSINPVVKCYSYFGLKLLNYSLEEIPYFKDYQKHIQTSSLLVLHDMGRWSYKTIPELISEIDEKYLSWIEMIKNNPEYIKLSQQ